MTLFDMQLEDIQLFDCAIIGKEVIIQGGKIKSLVFPCYNGGYWENPVNPKANPMFIDRTYLVFFDVSGFKLNIAEFDSFYQPKDVVRKYLVQDQFRDKHEPDFSSYLESKIYINDTLGDIWGQIVAKKTLVALPDPHVKMYSNDSLSETVGLKQNEMDFIKGHELDKSKLLNLLI
ncbi:hypothetical protein GCM10028807_10510 [Spirosoma daeguense]